MADVSPYGVRRLFPFCMLVACWSGEQTMRVMTNWWLSQWTGQETIRQIDQTLGAHTLLLSWYTLPVTVPTLLCQKGCCF